MTTHKNALQLALEKGKLVTRPIEEITRDQKETLRWAEEVARDFPVKVRRGRPPKDVEVVAPSRSVTVRFPMEQAETILAVAKRHGFTISEFVRAAAFQTAAKGTLVLPRVAAKPKPRRTPTSKV